MGNLYVNNQLKFYNELGCARRPRGTLLLQLVESINGHTLNKKKTIQAYKQVRRESRNIFFSVGYSVDIRVESLFPKKMIDVSISLAKD